MTARCDRLNRTVMDFFPESMRKEFAPVGRLDKDTEGLLLITNDGALAHELLSPKKHVAKTYYARIEGKVTAEDVAAFRKGLDIGEKNLTKPYFIRKNSNRWVWESCAASRKKNVRKVHRNQKNRKET